jgi:hypothetical protein
MVTIYALRTTNSPRGGSWPDFRSAAHKRDARSEPVAHADRPTAPTAATAPMKSRRLMVFLFATVRFPSSATINPIAVFYSIAGCAVKKIALARNNPGKLIAKIHNHRYIS